ncbi:hypothetical protein DFH06DRAFT_1136891 [Mycena polygramma]|nr:hypothetical protein DFH06DRAFT_1136891 [Mycena polygramma]
MAEEREGDADADAENGERADVVGLADGVADNVASFVRRLERRRAGEPSIQKRAIESENVRCGKKVVVGEKRINRLRHIDARLLFPRLFLSSHLSPSSLDFSAVRALLMHTHHPAMEQIDQARKRVQAGQLVRLEPGPCREKTGPLGLKIAIAHKRLPQGARSTRAWATEVVIILFFPHFFGAPRSQHKTLYPRSLGDSKAFCYTTIRANNSEQHSREKLPNRLGYRAAGIRQQGARTHWSFASEQEVPGCSLREEKFALLVKQGFDSSPARGEIAISFLFFFLTCECGGVTKRVGLGLPQSYGVGLSPMGIGLGAVSDSGCQSSLEMTVIQAIGYRRHAVPKATCGANWSF